MVKQDKYLNVGAVELVCPEGNLEYNLSMVEKYAQKAKEDNIDLLLFPELNLSGYISAPVDSEAIPDYGNTVRAVQNISEKYNIALSCGCVEVDNGKYYNTQFIVDNGEIAGSYRKTHVGGEKYSSGNEFPVISVRSWKVGIAICYDNNFSEVFRIYQLLGVDLVLAPSCGSWYSSKSMSKELMTEHYACYQARECGNARLHTLFVAYANQVGYVTCLDKELPGGAWIAGPQGEILSSTDYAKEKNGAMAVSKLDYAYLEQMRKKNVSVQYRRPELYEKYL